MKTEGRMHTKEGSGSMTFGIVLILLGVLFLMDNFYLIDFGNLLSDYWPVILIIIGVNIIFKHRNETGKERQAPDSHTE